MMAKKHRMDANDSMVHEILGNVWGRPFRIVFTAVLMLLVLFPLYWLFSSAFKIRAEYLANPPLLIPHVFTMENIKTVLSMNGLGRQFINSMIVSLSSTAISLLFGSMAAYSLVRGKFSNFTRQIFGLWFMIQKMYPAIATAIPIYLVMRKLQLIDTLPALIIMNTSFNLPLVIWLMMGFFAQVPIEMEESARIDGCHFLSRFFYVVFPVTKSGIVAAGILAFVGAWNEFLFAVILSINKSKTLPVVIAGFITDKGLDWGPMAATSLISLLPVLVLVYLCQKQFVEGLAMGAVKG